MKNDLRELDERVNCMSCLCSEGGQMPGVVVIDGVTHGLVMAGYSYVFRLCDFDRNDTLKPGVWPNGRIDRADILDPQAKIGGEHGNLEGVDCMTCLVSPVPQSLETESASPSERLAKVRGITHAVRSRSSQRYKLWAGWTLCGVEFRHVDDHIVECDGTGRANPVDQARGARGLPDSSAP